MKKISDKMSRVKNTEEHEYAPTGEEVTLVTSITDVKKTTIVPLPS